MIWFFKIVFRGHIQPWKRMYLPRMLCWFTCAWAGMEFMLFEQYCPHCFLTQLTRCVWGLLPWVVLTWSFLWDRLTSGQCCSWPVILLLYSVRGLGAQSPHLYITALSCVPEFLESSSRGIPRVIQLVAHQVGGHRSCSTFAVQSIKVA